MQWTPPARASTLLLILAMVLSAGALADGDESGIVGTWTLTLETPRGVQHPTLTVQRSDAGLTGVYEGRRGAQPIPHIDNTGANFSFPMKVTMPMGEMELHYSGTIDGDTMSGNIGNPRGSIPFTGKRAP